MSLLQWTHFVKASTIVGAPSDSNDGKDPLGIGLATAIYDHTGNIEGERHLSQVGAFTGYTFVAGDLIHLVGTGGVVTSTYEIASKVDNDAILLVANTGLTGDSTGADITSSDGPWLTLQYAFDTAAAGSRVVICADGGGTDDAWGMAATLDVDTQTGGTTGITYQGGNARGVVDGTIATVTEAAGFPGATHLVSIASVTVLVFNDLRFSGGTDRCITSAATTGSILFNRVRVDSAGSFGMYLLGSYHRIVDCEIDGHGATAGLFISTSASVSKSRIHDNTGIGIHCNNAHGIEINDCLVYNNTTNGITIHRRMASVASCTLFGNGADGINSTLSIINAAALPKITNCVFRSNSGYGINNTYGDVYAEIDYCCFSNNTSGDTNGVDQYLGDNNIYTDPLFVSEIDGAEDFTPAAGSPLINAGLSVPVR